ncbi:MAG: 3-methylcrotonyl-CoA carboxylase [Chloroflexi bacterium]|nr:MAG: 3-methylcrotonyl-CoA carboxylase [Chloroflexota bacterium]
MFKSVLIANRGEIAVRVMAACQEMGIRTIAIYSEADADALHVRCSDEAYPIGQAPAQESYLNSKAILEAARRSGAEAIHPGYGFLAENAEFAEGCADAGIVFIGPPGEAIRLMGSKTAAKRAVQEAGVPVVPGYDGAQRDLRTMQREAARIGYPVMIKAAAGGGGKGMRVVHRRDELADALAAAEREAMAAFGDESVFLEKLIPSPRHVEFQILADQYGCVVHLGERECSIQRRHQKIIEESPCVALTPELREGMGRAAISAARSAGYTNAGTCEFLLDGATFYFLEMNTRLQVEHPVTEMVTGLDLVRLQLAIAAGMPLPVRQEDINFRGHAIEARLYAEDPANEYLPSTGRVLFLEPPKAPGIRVDAGVATGDEVTVHYDPMLAKLIVYGADRGSAIERLRWALNHFRVLGVATNLPLLRAIADEADFAAGETSTSYLETHDFSEAVSPPPVPPLVLAAAALWDSLSTSSPPPAGPYNPWTSNVTASSRSDRRFRYQYGPGEFLVGLSPAAMGAGYRVTINDEPLFVEGEAGLGEPAAGSIVTATLSGGSRLTLQAGVHRWPIALARSGLDVEVSYLGQSYLLRKPRPLDSTSAAAAAGSPGERSGGHRHALTAPMAGTVIKVQVQEGEKVTANQTLVILGAMKMEHSIRSPYPGHIIRVPHGAGDVVSGGEVLVELDTGGGDEEEY